MEQIVFNTVNQIVFFKYSNSMFHANVNYYSFKLLVLMLFYVNQIDHLLDIEKYFDIARSSLNSLKSGFSQSPVSVKKGMLQNASRSNVQYNEQKHLKPNIQEEAMFRDLTVIVIGLLCDKTHILMISQSNKTFIQEIILHNLIEHSDEISRLMNYTAKIIKGNFEANDLIDLIYQNPQEKRRFYSILEISTVQVSSKSKNFTNRRLTKLNNLISQPPEDELARMGKLFDSIGQNLRSFWKYISKFTSDITSGKSTWIEIESHLEKGINDSSKSFNVLELLINYIFSTNRTKVVNQQSSSNKVELQRGSIKEAPITPSTQQINNTLDKPTGYEDYRILIASIFEFLSESISSETPLVILFYLDIQSQRESEKPIPIPSDNI